MKTTYFISRSTFTTLYNIDHSVIVIYTNNKKQLNKTIQTSKESIFFHFPNF